MFLRTEAEIRCKNAADDQTCERGEPVNRGGGGVRLSVGFFGLTDLCLCCLAADWRSNTFYFHHI